MVCQLQLIWTWVNMEVAWRMHFLIWQCCPGRFAGRLRNFKTPSTCTSKVSSSASFCNCLPHLHFPCIILASVLSTLDCHYVALVSAPCYYRSRIEAQNLNQVPVQVGQEAHSHRKHHQCSMFVLFRSSFYLLIVRNRSCLAAVMP